MSQPFHNFWSDSVRNDLRQYISTDDPNHRSRIFSRLYRPIMIMIDISLHKKKISDEDWTQECLMFIYQKVLPRITEDRIITSQQYIHRSLNNHILNMIKKNSRDQNNIGVFIDHNTLNHHFDTVYKDIIYEDDYINERTVENKINIIKRLDLLAREQRVLNKPNTIFILLLKQYCLDNDFDVRQFNQYAMEKMGISSTTFNIICSRLGIRSKVLNELYIKKCYLKDEDVSVSD